MSSSVLYVSLYSVSLDSALQVMAVMVLILATKFSISKLVVCVWSLYSKAEKFLVLSVLDLKLKVDKCERAFEFLAIRYCVYLPKQFPFVLSHFFPLAAKIYLWKINSTLVFSANGTAFSGTALSIDVEM